MEPKESTSTLVDQKVLQHRKVIKDSNGVFRKLTLNTPHYASTKKQQITSSGEGLKFDIDLGVKSKPLSAVCDFTSNSSKPLSFDLTASSTATDDGELEIDIKYSQDSVSISEVTNKPLDRLENVTFLSRSLISPELRAQLSPKRITIMSTSNDASNGNSSDTKQAKKGIFGKRISGKRSSQSDLDNSEGHISVPRQSIQRASTDSNVKAPSTEPTRGRRVSDLKPSSENEGNAPRRGMWERLRSVSRSSSRSRNMTAKEDEPHKPMLVAVTSCRSDAYYNQNAPGSTSKLPRKAPSNLKLFHELAVGIKDAYAAVGQTPTRPTELDNTDNSSKNPFSEGNTVLWEFIGNLDFLLALVDEVAIDTATRGALKDDTTFKSLRDVIKKGNKVLEGMLVRRERRYTLFFRLIHASEVKEISKLKSWNSKVEKAIGSVADDPVGNDTSESESDAESILTSLSEMSTASSARGGSFLGRGRQMLPSAGRVKSRRATPTPSLRIRAASQDSSSAAEDGFAAGNSVSQGNMASLELGLLKDMGDNGIKSSIPALMPPPPPNQPQFTDSIKPMEAKEELIDVIRGLRTEKLQKREGNFNSELQNLKPNWLPKADIPSSVPKLPTEYIHRHRLMKQAVNCLLDQNGAGPRDKDEETYGNSMITVITSRHADKPGNGKTTLAVATIQTVEIRERFSEGIAWIQLGRNPLTEKDVRRLYEEMFRQLVTKDGDYPEEENTATDCIKEATFQTSQVSQEKNNTVHQDMRFLLGDDNAIRLAESRQRFQGGDLDAIKEDLANIITKRKILICLDDVWRVDDAKWFIFENKCGSLVPSKSNLERFPYRILMTSRTPGLLGNGVAQEVFVRIFSEHEAVKLLLSSAGRRPYGGKQSAVFNQARIIVKGCGNSPMAVRLAGGMLRRWNRNWNISSPTWKSLIEQSKHNLEEASRLRSFVNSVTRIIDLGFSCIPDMEFRVVVKRCFITFAVAFRDNDWVHIGKGIPKAALLKIFSAVNASKNFTADDILFALETMNLLERARHGTTAKSLGYNRSDSSESDDEEFGEEEMENCLATSMLPSFVMQDSLRTVGEEFAKRQLPAFLPDVDDFTSFGKEVIDERKYHESRVGMVGGAMRSLSKVLNGGRKDMGLSESEVHALVAGCLAGVDCSHKSSNLIEEFKKNKAIMKAIKDCDELEEYIAFFLPMHLIKSHNYSLASELLVDPDFVKRRVKALGTAEATRKHISDLLDLRRVLAKEPSASQHMQQKPIANSQSLNPKLVSKEVEFGETLVTTGSAESIDDSVEKTESVDTSMILRDGCRIMVDEVHQVISKGKVATDSLKMAICLSSIGEGLMKGKQPRDAIMRLEEAFVIYRKLLGENHVDVARSLHSVARALSKIGENRVALLKFTEAAEIYDRCKASMHYDAIANSQNMASLLVDLGEWERATTCFEDVISRKRKVHGEGNVSVAKTINSYAILLAKHGRMNEALRNYEAAKATYEAVSPSILQDAEFEIKCKYDITLINLNIASIRSKKGDLAGAIKSYADGVRGLRQYAASQEKQLATTGVGETGKSSSHVKHLVAALGRIGSLKLKVGDNSGALEAYKALLNEVAEDSPTASKIEAAKAHIKCATIYRQDENSSSRPHSISHLREALSMYTVLFGKDHKDTLAIASSLRLWLEEEQTR